MRRILATLALILALLAPVAGQPARAETCFACIHATPMSRPLDSFPASNVKNVRVLDDLGTQEMPATGGASDWYIARVGTSVALSLGADGLNRATGKHVVVEVIDTGLDADLVPSVISATSVLASWTYSPLYGAHSDDIGHGSFVAGEIVGHGIGAPGVCPQCQIRMARVFGADGGASTSDIARAIYWGIKMKVNVISMSLGGPTDDPALAEAITTAARAGIIVVSASGNDGRGSVSYPAGDMGSLAIGASDFNDAIASFSNYGAGLTLVAPGTAIPGYLPLRPTLISREIGQQPGFSILQGTSMATPLVAGAVADLLSLGVAPKLAVTAITSGARRPFGWDAFHFGAGVLSLTGALRQLGYPV